MKLQQEKNTAIQQAQQSQGDEGAIEQLETVYEMAESHRMVALDAIGQLAEEQIEKELAVALHV